MQGGRGRVARTSSAGSPRLRSASREQDRIAHAAEHLGRIPPQRAPGGERADGAGMILEAREVHDRVALDAPRGARRGVRGEAVAPKREGAHRRVLVEIAERIDCRHREAGSRRRFGGRPRREARDEDARWKTCSERSGDACGTSRSGDPKARPRRGRRDHIQMVEHRAGRLANAQRIDERRRPARRQARRRAARRPGPPAWPQPRSP